MPHLASQRLPPGDYFEAERVFSSMNSEPSLGSRDDIYVTARESWTATAPAVGV
jgi:hypothetical protein